MPCSHMISTLLGPDGTRELLMFATGMGLKGAWIQNVSTPTEHFDLLGKGRIDAAREQGATEVTMRVLGEHIRAKRVAAKGTKP